MASDYPDCFKNPIYWCAWQSSRIFFSTAYKMDVYGTSHIPKQGPFILAGNHASFFDPPAFGCALPRELAYFARKTLFKPGWPERLLKALNSIPVDRDGDSDISAFKQVFATLKANKGILLFPEGTRSPNGSLQKAQRGVGLIACRANVPVVPARIIGSFEAYSRKMKYPAFKAPISIIYGEAIMPEVYDPGKGDPKRYKVAANRIMQRIENLNIPHPIGSI